ncbi:hypothetical protein PISMIDRAFT_196896 [Pisolithus microcarpus 441]|uniref:Uncharacterized protein n=1 Tax=Pisolithus microcarpus 441 TaxID=765257 RepID=A0A0C9YW37_9AGAM|nr:hypothetical protein BKA83DRAFT_196896 [Pisolithus microcarpus]KIK18184.1 hypothetical protein PISMIDRAFT_196896 [Pisolithus microcarpus 441]
MAEKISPGQYFVTSLLNNDNLGVSDIGPLIFPPPPAPVIVLPRGVLPPRFTVVPVDTGEPNAYVVVVSNRTTRGQEDRVFAFADEPAEVWIIVYREYHKAYTIERRGGPVGWTAPESEEPEPRQIVLSPIISTKSLPPQFLPSQLFKFERVPEQ